MLSFSASIFFVSPRFVTTLPQFPAGASEVCRNRLSGVDPFCSSPRCSCFLSCFFCSPFVVAMKSIRVKATKRLLPFNGMPAGKTSDRVVFPKPALLLVAVRKQMTAGGGMNDPMASQPLPLPWPRLLDKLIVGIPFFSCSCCVANVIDIDTKMSRSARGLRAKGVLRGGHHLGQQDPCTGVGRKPGRRPWHQRG